MEPSKTIQVTSAQVNFWPKGSYDIQVSKSLSLELRFDFFSLKLKDILITISSARVDKGRDMFIDRLGDFGLIQESFQRPLWQYDPEPPLSLMSCDPAVPEKGAPTTLVRNSNCCKPLEFRVICSTLTGNSTLCNSLEASLRSNLDKAVMTRCFKTKPSKIP